MARKQESVMIQVMYDYNGLSGAECNVQFQNRYTKDWSDYHPGYYPTWDWSCCDYRIKPVENERTRS